MAQFIWAGISGFWFCILVGILADNYMIPKSQWKCVETASIQEKAECITYKRINVNSE